MLAISDAVKEAWLNPARQLSIRVKVDKTMYGSEDVSSLSFDSGSISGEVYQIGSTYMNSVTLSFPSIIETIKEDLEVIPELGILVDGEYHFFKLGHFYITEFNRDRNANITTITANDKMIYLEGAYDSKLTYPKPYREVALEIANLAGVEVNQASFASLGIGAIKKPEGYTYRQAIGLIAQFEGGFASFNRDGELEIRRLRPTEFGVTPESYLLKGFTKNENSYKIGGITVRIGEEETDVLKIGNTTGPQIELENKVMTQTLLNQMWELVKTLNYFPFELKWRGCPALEAGDWIYVTDRNGNRYSVPNLSYSMNFNGGLSAESKATTNSVSQSATKYRGSLNQKVQWLESILGSNDWNHNYYDEKPDNPKVGDLWFKKTGKDIEIWQYVEIDGVRDWELQISSAPNQDLLDMIEDLVGATADAQAAADEAKTAGEEAAQLANEAKTESAKALEDANAAINSVTNLGQIVQAVDKASQLAIEQSANAVADAQAAMVKANELLTSVNEIEGTITNITADIDAINGELAVKVDQTTFNQLKGTVDTHTTSISANAQAIKLKANQTEVDTISGKVNANSAELSVQADKIAGLVTKTDGQATKIGALELQAGQFNLTLSQVQQDVAGIEVGGRNYYKKSTTISGKSGLTDIRKEYQDAVNGFYFVGISGNTGGLRINNVINSSGWWTVSFWVRGSQSTAVGFYLDICDLQATRITTTNDNTWKYVTHSVNVTNYTSSLHNFVDFDSVMWNYFYIKDFKVEKGNKATDWSPAPEDMATVTALTSVQATVDGLVTTVATKANQSQVTQLADQITSVVTDLSGLDTDSANYLAGTSDNNKVATRIWDFNIVRPLIAGEYYTFSFYLKGSTPVNGLLVYLNDDTGQNRTGWQAVSATTINVTTNLQYYIFKMKVTKAPSDSTDRIMMRVYSSSNTTVVLTGNKAMLVKGLNDKTWSLPPEETASRSQITQLTDQLNLRVQKGEVISQINISTEGILIAGEKVWISGLTKIDNAVIATAHIKDLAVTNAKIANLAVNTAKIGDAAIVTAKIGDLAVTNAKIANLAINDAKIQNASISSAKIISLDANKISAATLSAITANTGDLNVSGNLTMVTDNSTIKGSYVYGETEGTAYGERHFNGDFLLGRRFVKYNGNVYTATSTGGQGAFRGYAESFYGLDYFKMRLYDKADVSSRSLKNRIDMREGTIELSQYWNSVGTMLKNNLVESHEIYARDNVKTGRVNTRTDYASFQIAANDSRLPTLYLSSGNGGFMIKHSKNNFANLYVGSDGSPRIWSPAFYSRTYSNGANVYVTSEGTLGRSTSAKKYKVDIQKADAVIKNALKILDVFPKSWLDKVEYLNGNAKHRYYGFIADDFHEAGLTEVVVYENGEIESLAYDRISMYHNVILSEHEKEINLLKKKVEILENEIRVLQVA